MFEKTERVGLLKDKQSGAIVNDDINKLEAYRKQKMIFRESKEAMKKINTLEEEMRFIKDELSKIRKDLKKQ